MDDFTTGKGKYEITVHRWGNGLLELYIDGALKTTVALSHSESLEVSEAIGNVMRQVINNRKAKIEKEVNDEQRTT